MDERRTQIASTIASALLGGSWEYGAHRDMVASALGKKWRWIKPLLQRLHKHFSATVCPSHLSIVRFLLNDGGFHNACRSQGVEIIRLLVPEFRPILSAKKWDLPRIRTTVELSDWVGVSVSELEWFADLRNLTGRAKNSRLGHYHYRILAKRFGSIRMIESPKPRLKRLQSEIHQWILNAIPAHSAAHGFVRGRSTASFAEPHVGKRMVLRIDLQDFFTTIKLARIQAIFVCAGYPYGVARLLAGICTTRTPRDVWSRESQGLEVGRLMQVAGWYDVPHLPQGAPTSPALANLVAYRLDCRLSAFAESSQAIYTRYADDLVFSGGDVFARSVYRFRHPACAIVMEEGFRVNHYKTKVMPKSVRQKVAGLVVNRRCNVPRKEFDQLKATLTNCVRQGPATQNRIGHRDFRSHLLGRISYVASINERRGERLTRLFQQIQW